jgi:hypothetical protein
VQVSAYVPTIPRSFIAGISLLNGNPKDWIISIHSPPGAEEAAFSPPDSMPLFVSPINTQKKSFLSLQETRNYLAQFL